MTGKFRNTVWSLEWFIPRVFKCNCAKLFVIVAQPNRALAPERSCICCQVVSRETQVVRGSRPGKAQYNLNEWSGAGMVSISSERPQIWGQLFVFTWRDRGDTVLTVSLNVMWSKEGLRMGPESMTVTTSEPHPHPSFSWIWVAQS